MTTHEDGARAALREMIARLIEPYYWQEGLDGVVSTYPDSPAHKERARSLEKADAILAVVEFASYRIVPADLLADLVRGIIATHDCHNCAESSAGVRFDYDELRELLVELDGELRP